MPHHYPFFFGTPEEEGLPFPLDEDLRLEHRDQQILNKHGLSSNVWDCSVQLAICKIAQVELDKNSDEFKAYCEQAAKYPSYW